MGTRFSKSKNVKANVKTSSKNLQHSTLLCSPCLSIQVCLGFKQQTKENRTNWNNSSTNSKISQTARVQDINNLDSQLNNNKLSQSISLKQINENDCNSHSDKVFTSKFETIKTEQPQSAVVSCYLHAPSSIDDVTTKSATTLTKFNSEVDEKSIEENKINEAQSNVSSFPLSSNREDLSKENSFSKNEGTNGDLAIVEEINNKLLIDGESGEAIVPLSSQEIPENTKGNLELENISANVIENSGKTSKVVTKFRKLVEKETSILNQLIDNWNILLADTTIPDEVCDEIRAVIGKTRLIISQRFTQFIKLVNQAEDASNKTTARPVFESDLDGFWEMDYIQVKEIKESYEKLSLKKVNHWKSNEAAPAKNKNNKKTPKKVPVLKNKSVTPEVEARRKEAAEKRRKAMQEMRLKKKKLMMQKRNEDVFLQFNHHKVDVATQQKSELTMNENIDGDDIEKDEKLNVKEITSDSTITNNPVKTDLPKNVLESPTDDDVIADVIISSNFLPTCNGTVSNKIPLTPPSNIPLPQTAIVG